MKNIISKVFIFALLLVQCAPKEQVIFKTVENLNVGAAATGKPLLKADAVFFNPNKNKMKLKEIDLLVWVNETKSAEIKQKLDVDIPAQSDFSVPIEAQLVLNETNLMNTVLSFFGGKKNEITFKGFIRLRIHGLTIKVPVSQKQEIKLN